MHCTLMNYRAMVGLGQDASLNRNIMRPAYRKRSTASTLDDASSSSSPSKSINSHPPSRSRSKSKPKPKSKRRHHCPRPNCHATFTRITDMERHLGSVHRAREGGTVDEACRCSFCGKVFSREDAVLRHENDSCPVRVKKRKW